MAKITEEQHIEKAVFVGVIKQGDEERQVMEYLDELEFLAETAGAIGVKKFIQKVDRPDSRTYIRSGKLQEIREYCEENEIELVIFDDELKAIAQEIVRSGEMDRILIGLDFFDASINRIAAWIIGARNIQKALLFAMLEPTEMLKKFELEMDYTSRLAWLEELKSMPFEAVWDKYCEECGVPVGTDWINEVKDYEKDVLLNR